MSANSVNSAINKVKIKSIAQQVFGWSLAVFFGGFGSIGAASSKLADAIDFVLVTMFAALAAIGIWLIVKGKQNKNLIHIFYDYSARLSSDPDMSVDLLALATGKSVDATNKNLSRMISYGFFPNAYFDTSANRMIFNDAKETFAKSEMPIVEQGMEYVTVQCKNCGATGKIVRNSVGECEFCGSQISE